MRIFNTKLSVLVAGLGLVASAWGSTASAQTGFEWRRSGTGMRIPGEAYIGGQEDGTPLVVCRAPYLGGVYPGKLVKGNCNISYDSREVYLHDFDILVGQGGQWGPPRPGLAGAFIAGYERGGPLFLCQALYRGGLHPGKVYHDACDISYGGREIPIRRFSVFYIGVPEVATFGGAPYPPTVIYHYESTTTNHYYPPSRDWRADEARRREDQQRADDLRDRQQQEQQRAEYERNQQYQRDLRDGQQQEQQRAAYERHQQEQQAQQAAEEARARAEGEAEENRQALKAQAQAEEDARRAEEIKRGEEEENRMAAEAQAKAQDEARQEEIKRGEEEENRMAAEAAAKAQEEAQRQAEIKQGEDEENRMAAEAAAKAQAESPPADTPPPNL